MATYYWVGGSGNWNATSTTNWASSSGGAGGAGVPTSADDVIFDAGSNTGTDPFTVTVTGTSSAPAVCRDFSTGGAGGALDGAMTLTMGATAVLDVFGSFTAPASSFATSGTSGAQIQFGSTTTGNSITSNGVAFTNINFAFFGVGGEWTLGSALTANAVFINGGTLNTANYNLTLASIQRPTSSSVTVLNLGSSAITCSGTTAINFASVTNLTLNAGTSTITCSASSPTFTGGGLTFYNVTFSSTSSGTTTISGTNTFNDLTITSRSATGVRVVAFSNSQTVNGALTFGAANTAIRRVLVSSSTIGTQITITLNGSLSALADVDFRDIVAAGTVATPWTGTRLGDGKNNSNITLDAPKTVYWNLAGSQNWSATGWATTNTGSPAVNNFPLPQDTAVFTEAGSAGTVTMDAPWWIGSINMADGVSNRTTAFTLATGAQSLVVYGNITFFSSLTLTGTQTVFVIGQGTTQSITSAGVSFTQPITVNSPSGTVQLSDNLTNTNTNTAFNLTAGTLDLNNNTLTCVGFNSSNSNTRTIAFGTGNITVTGSSGGIWTTGTSTNLTITGTPVVNFTYAGAAGTRTITMGAAGEANAISVNVTAGTDIVSLGASSGAYKNINFTGFAGTLSNNAITIYGNLTISTGMTLTAGSSVATFAATSGTQTVTSNGKTIGFPVTVNAAGAIVKFADAFTQGSTRNFTFSGGTVEFPASTTSTVGNFVTTGTTQKTLRSTTTNTQATLSEASGVVDATYVTIRDINATGGATWNALTDRGAIDGGNTTGWNFTTAGVTNILNRVFYKPILRPVLRG